MSLVLDQMDLAGKVAIVKGSGRRLGKAMAIALAGTGADLVVTVRRMEIEETAQEIEKKGNRTFSIQADIATQDSLINWSGRPLNGSESSTSWSIMPMWPL
jgi:NAD(P)-dependent dehydrogenase (short-subunit alcohol dehydrogenase family)